MHKQLRHKRIVGFLLICFGVWGWKFCVTDVLERAERREPTIVYQHALAGLIPAAVGAGLLLLILGPRTDAVLGTPGHRPLLGKVVIGLLLIAGLAGFMWLEMKLRGMGYRPIR